MGHHIVLGTGGIGRATAAHLVRAGHTVTMASRSGRTTTPLPEGPRYARSTRPTPTD